jgi:hypothetical protein
MKITLETLIGIIKTSDDALIKGNAAINLANILFEIYDRQQASEIPEIIKLDEDEDDFDE